MYSILRSSFGSFSMSSPLPPPTSSKSPPPLSEIPHRTSSICLPRRPIPCLPNTTMLRTRIAGSRGGSKSGYRFMPPTPTSRENGTRWPAPRERPDALDVPTLQPVPAKRLPPRTRGRRLPSGRLLRQTRPLTIQPRRGRAGDARAAQERSTAEHASDPAMQLCKPCWVFSVGLLGESMHIRTVFVGKGTTNRENKPKLNK